MDKLKSCNTCNEDHPKGKTTRSQIEKTKRIIWQAREINSYMDLETTTCKDCKRSTIMGDHQTCGACGQTRYKGGRIHCFTHCLEFIEAPPEERLKMVQTHRD